MFLTVSVSVDSVINQNYFGQEALCSNKSRMREERNRKLQHFGPMSSSVIGQCGSGEIFCRCSAGL